MTHAERTIRNLLTVAEVEVNGGRPWDIVVHDDSLFDRVLTSGSLGLGESYMDGQWECERIDEMLTRVLRADLASKIRPSVALVLYYSRARVFNRQVRSRAYNIGIRHYDIGNDLYTRMLDRGMNYSCGYWKNATTLDEAQEAKVDLVCRKMLLEPGMRVLDIGCGWGGFAEHAARRYGATVVGITVSREQAEFARKRCESLPVEIRLQDYRELDESFDRIVSIGMVEHVGYRNYRTYMQTAGRCLVPDGLFLLHTIGSNRSVHSTDPWMDRYIFPDGMLPSARQLTTASEGLFRLDDWHSFGPYYDPTLMAWHANFTRSWSEIEDHYDRRFYRMWTYYLLASAAGFRSRQNQLWQIVFSPLNSGRSYESVR